MPLSRCLRFRTEHFDYTTELPAEYNAGNRFYGRDVAAFIAEKLTAIDIGADYLDEDWGWMVFSTGHQVPSFEIAIYNLSEHSEGARPGVNEWGLWLHAYEQTKLLGLFPITKEAPVPEILAQNIITAFANEGIALETWSDGPNSDA